MPSAGTKRKKKIELPSIEPLRLVRRQDAFENPDWLFELKYDGYRALLYIEPNNPRFISRHGKHMPRFDELARAIAERLKLEDAIFDGELVCLDQAGRPQFNELLFRRGEPYYAAFDLLWLEGKDLRNLPLLKRKERLNNVVSGKPRIGYVSHYPFAGQALFESVKKMDLEGIVAKKMNAPYGAGTTWYKIKNPTYSQAEGRHELFERMRNRQ
jgi:bifunctional non-homologous end joining protein LigD